ncbi:MAG: hypothetical protein HYS73_01025 [Parcubacteria group bacterium]|nr:hypothetical protein [Parcubacteria group bacterium]
MRNYFLVLGVFAASALALAGSYKFFQTSSINSLKEEANAALENGDYLASLQKYSDLKEKGKDAPDAPRAEAKIIESKNFLVAEEMFRRAEKAKEDGDWFAVKALLKDADATTNNSFKSYEQAAALYLEAANKVSDLEKKIEAELAKFRQEAVQEKARRESAEEVVTEAKEEVAEVKQKLETTIREKEVTAAELQAATSQKNAAIEAAARERFLKFLNEIDLYANILTSADGFLNGAEREILGGRGAYGYSLLENGRPLLTQTKTGAEDLLNNRTEEQHKGEVRVLLQSAALFTEASRSFRNAIVFIEKDDQTAAENFTRFMNEGKAAKLEAIRLLNAAKEFVVSSRS